MTRRVHPSRRFPTAGLVAMSGLIVIGAMHAACGPSGETPPVEAAVTEPPPTPRPDQPLPPLSELPLEVTLYFAGDDGRLRTEKRQIRPDGPVSLRARRAVQALLEGPRGDLIATMPEETALREIYLTPDGTAFVDLNAAFEQGLMQGSEQALLAVRSLINTITANFSEVRRVQILVEGEEVRDLGGHLDLSRPLLPDRQEPVVRDNL